MSFGAQRMAYAFLALVIAFAALSTIYLWRNDFARETLDVIFPAVGAIALSLYLGFKTVYLDAPAAHRSRVPIALLHDRASGTVQSMAQLTATDPIESLSEFEGIRELDPLPLYNAFSPLKVNEHLRVVGNADSTAADSMLTELVEYAILAWLAKPQNTVGYTDSGTIYLLQGGGGGGAPSAILKPVSVRTSSIVPNVFLDALPISIRLPARSTIDRKSSDHVRTINIRTPNSYFTIALSLRGGGVFDGAMSPAAVALRKRLHLPNRTPQMWTAAFMIELESNQAGFSRFSYEAKLEKEWLERMHAQFDADFSWDRLRARLASGK